MTAPNLVNLDSTLAALGLQSDDQFGTISNLISTISQMVCDRCGRNFISANYNVTLDGRGRNRIRMPHTPITAVASVVIVLGGLGTLSVPARTINQPGQPNIPGYTFSDKFIYVDPPYQFNRGLQNIQISYTGGYVATPTPVQQACYTWIKAILDAQNYSAFLAKAKAGQTQLDFGFFIAKFNGNSIAMPPSVYTMLLPYIRQIPDW